MFWTEFTVDTLILLYVLGLFALIIICLYALIQSKANKLYTFIIIPLALIMASMTWQGIKVLQGMPVYGLPEKEVEVMWVNDNKPWIYVILKKDGVPVLYKIDWTEENKKKMKELQKMIGSSLAQGKFEETESNNGESNSYVFTPMMDLGEPEEKRSGNDGVEYTPAQSVNTSPNRPSLETVVDGEAVILPSVVYGPLTEEQAGP
jgi:hypothetical protein